MKTESEIPLEPRQLEEMKLIGAMIARAEPATEIECRWKEFVERSKDKFAQFDVFELVQLAIREAYQENVEDLQFYAEKIKYLNDLKKRIRDELEEIRKTMAAHINSLEQRLSTVGEDAQLANIDLQNALQKHQQVVQMLSNISKMLHDTAMNIIRNLK
ncbi:hypothetical protein ACFL6S_00695 [Candidatus Poribacteria bacterium]